MASLKIALQLYSLRDDMPKDPFGTVKAVAEAGFDGVEFAGFYGKSALEWREFLDKLSLEVAGAHIGVGGFIGDELNKTIEYNRLLWNRNLVIPGVPEEWRRGKAGWLRFAGMLNDWSRVLRAYGMRIGYHNHWLEFQPIEGELPFHLIFSNTDSSVMVQIDIGHAYRAGLSNSDIVELIKRYGGRVVSVHVKDYSKEKGYNLAVGEGELNWPEILSALRKYGGTEWLIIENEEYPYKPPIETVKVSIRNLRNILSTVS
ncbi:sugar phosphate isomerase/epimerase family protein [Caldivirga maquilingensis]|uniref:Xylose isomerase domain protein TIM barrel n=1 Tax=Caldivirga maquilingensis (strain ATCC 700844 / DSM 13496 / JCM 10307 / IC-167) TaxID=397948 RepID=A8MBT4_CALMQ|nr:sugar phosphate isomerase/epimerase [Caldivirga maquilingensis]ABW01277.1 Xylose isomerase domain protein TIM barrel [Caldivirga maquilingensis IC-167]